MGFLIEVGLYVDEVSIMLLFDIELQELLLCEVVMDSIDGMLICMVYI